MAQNLVVGGDTYEGVERVAATNTDGEVIVYPEGGDTASNAVQYVHQTLKPEEKSQARKNIDALGQDDIYFRHNAYTYNGQTEHINTVTINVRKVVDGKEVVESVEIGTTTLYEHVRLHGYEGEIAEFYDALARNMQTLKADGLELDPKENILYLTSGGKRIGTGVGFPEGGAGRVVTAYISYTSDDGYEVKIDGVNVAASDLKEIIDNGGTVIGVASTDVNFPLVDRVNFTVSKNTRFQCASGSQFYAEDFEKRFMLTYENNAWVGSMFAYQFMLSLTDSSHYKVEWSNQGLDVYAARNILTVAMQTHSPVHCYQANAVFYAEDGVGLRPPEGSQFYFDYNKAAFVFEADGYEYSMGLYNEKTNQVEYRPTAKKTTAYRVAESKADDLEVDGGELFLLSAGERISEGIPLPSGGGSGGEGGGVIAPVNGFFTMSVDSDGNLWAHSAEGGTTPDFEYDSETGNLYFLTEQE